MLGSLWQRCFWAASLGAFVALGSGCGVDAAERPRVRPEAVVYGSDDRVEPEAAPPLFAALARSSVVALLNAGDVQIDAGAVVIQAATLEHAAELCPGENFADQPAPVRASGVLIGDDLVVTAGHVFTGDEDCGRFRYVFGYTLEPGQRAPTVAPESVYECAELVRLISSPLDARCQWDLAVVRLARPVHSGLTPVQIRVSEFTEAEALAVVGFPAGLPAKVDLGSRVVDARAEHGDYFTLNSDTFFASSGSGVFDRSARLVGIFARGSADFDRDDAGACNRVHHELDFGAEGYEEATRSSGLLQSLGVAGAPSAEQCVLKPVCDAAPCEPLRGREAIHIAGPAPAVPKPTTSGSSCSIATARETGLPASAASCSIAALALSIRRWCLRRGVERGRRRPRRTAHDLGRR